MFQGSQTIELLIESYYYEIGLKCCLFMYKGIHAYCFINIQNLESGSDLWAGGNKVIFSSGARFQLIDFLNVTDLNRAFLNPVK